MQIQPRNLIQAMLSLLASLSEGEFEGGSDRILATLDRARNAVSPTQARAENPSLPLEVRGVCEVTMDEIARELNGGIAVVKDCVYDFLRQKGKTVGRGELALNLVGTLERLRSAAA
jgi:hypothetical protein